MAFGNEVQDAPKTLAEQVSELIGAIRNKIALLTTELADAKKELAAVRSTLTIPRRKAKGKKVVKAAGKKRGGRPKGSKNKKTTEPTAPATPTAE